MRLRIASVCLTFALLAGCDENSPTVPTVPNVPSENIPTPPPPPPPDVNFNGTWSGVMFFEGVAEGGGTSMTADAWLYLNQDGSAITGTWQWLPLGNVRPNRSTLTGTADGDAVALTFVLGDCAATAKGTRDGRALTLRSDGFKGPEADDLCRTSTVTASVTKQ